MQSNILSYYLIFSVACIYKSKLDEFHVILTNMCNTGKPINVQIEVVLQFEVEMKDSIKPVGSF